MTYPPQPPNSPDPWGQQGSPPGGFPAPGGQQPYGQQGFPPGGFPAAGGPQQPYGQPGFPPGGPPPGYGPPGAPGFPGGGPPQKSKTGLIVGLAIGAVVLIGGAITLILLLTGGGDESEIRDLANTFFEAGEKQDVELVRSVLCDPDLIPSDASGDGIDREYNMIGDPEIINENEAVFAFEVKAEGKTDQGAILAKKESEGWCLSNDVPDLDDLPDLPELDIPDMPDIDVPDLDDMPDIDIPDLDDMPGGGMDGMPDIDIPDLDDMPGGGMDGMPDFP